MRDGWRDLVERSGDKVWEGGEIKFGGMMDPCEIAWHHQFARAKVSHEMDSRGPKDLVDAVVQPWDLRLEIQLDEFFSSPSVSHRAAFRFCCRGRERGGQDVPVSGRWFVLMSGFLGRKGIVGIGVRGESLKFR